MSREPHAEAQHSAGRSRARSMCIAEFVERRLADARAQAELGRLADANERLLELRTGLVGRSPGDAAGLLRDGSASLRHRAASPLPSRLEPAPGRDASSRPAMGETRAGIAPTGGRSDWLEAIQLSAQAISDLTAISAASNAHTLPGIRSAALAAWEARHRDRIGRWARRALTDSRVALHGAVDDGGVETATGLDHRTAASTDPSLHAVRSLTPPPPGTSPETGLHVLPGSSRDEGSP
jgi:hypothetical protein